MKSLTNVSYNSKSGCGSNGLYETCTNYVSYYNLGFNNSDFDNMTSFTFAVNGNYSEFTLSGSYVQNVFVLQKG